jgi:hypothetical protein
MEYNIRGIIRGVQRGAPEIKIRFITDTAATRLTMAPPLSAEALA